VVDLQLAQGTGFGVIRRLREKGYGPCCIVVMTNHAVPALKVAAFEAGADFFLDKSRDFGHLPKVAMGLFKATLAASLRSVQDHARGRARERERQPAPLCDDSGKKLDGVVMSSNVTLGACRPGGSRRRRLVHLGRPEVCIAVDRYETVEANLQAIHHIIEARRVELRHGTLALVRATFSGLPRAAGAEGLELARGAGLRQPRARSALESREGAVPVARSSITPDKGGTDAEDGRVNLAYEQPKRSSVAENSAKSMDRTFNPWIGCTRVSPGVRQLLCGHAHAGPLPARQVGRWRAALPHQPRQLEATACVEPEGSGERPAVARVLLLARGRVRQRSARPVAHGPVGADRRHARADVDASHEAHRQRHLSHAAQRLARRITVVNQEEADRDIPKLLRAWECGFTNGREKSMAKRPWRIEVYKGEGTQPHRFRVVAGNGEITLPPEGHTRSAGALRAAQRLKDGIATAEIVVVDNK
jgi:CheY-like chemotaxis protein/uncharacterized protein YegP (UPF0339 family)